MQILVRSTLLLLYSLFLTLALAGNRADPELTITLERAPNTSDRTITLQATVKNISKHDFTIGVEGPLTDYSITVTDTRGVAVPLSRYGKEFFSKGHISSSMYVMVTLRPGETRVDNWSIDELFELARPARYLVTVRREFAAVHEAVSSNVLEVVLR